MKKKVVLIVGLLTIIITIRLISNWREHNSAKEFYSHKIILKGIIQKKTHIQKNEGFYSISIKECNSTDFDLRKDNKDYRLIIKGSKAEFIDTYYSTIEPLDSIIIDLLNKNVKIFRQDTLIVNFQMDDFMPTKWFPEQLKILHEL